jgi:hypothetical protein
MRRHLLLAATLRNERCGARTNRGDRKLVLSNPSRLDRRTRCPEPGASAPAPAARLVRISPTGLLLPQYQLKVFTISFRALFGELAIHAVARDQELQASIACRDRLIVGAG